jgi:hypothetical protein
VKILLEFGCETSGTGIEDNFSGEEVSFRAFGGIVVNCGGGSIKREIFLWWDSA